MNRRRFLHTNSLILGGLVIGPQSLWSMARGSDTSDFVSQRPPVSQRTFMSEGVERIIREVSSRIADPELGWMFRNCFPNTLDTTVDYEIIDGRPDTFVITGDIDAMWLRDSTAQVWPYMPLVTGDEPLKDLVHGLINRQTTCILTDPYANAFYKDLTRESEWKSDVPAPKPGVHERKWEIDSLCYPIRLAHEYYRLTGDVTPFDSRWNEAMRTVIETFRVEQRWDGTSPYTFRRRTMAMIDAPVFDGTGRPFKPTGMICSMFRPSDDATMYPFLVPSNLFAARVLRQLAHLYVSVFRDIDFANECIFMAKEIQAGIEAHAVADHTEFGSIYAYEVDGFGNRVLMDDANVPSLMSLAYLGIHSPADPLYANTRRFLLSDHNPWFLKGTAAEGQASPHTGKDKIWPMGIILRAMTSTEPDEVRSCLKMLKATHAGTGFMHEAFHKDDPSDYNRAWFAWANTLFGELIVNVSGRYPDLLGD